MEAPSLGDGLRDVGEEICGLMGRGGFFFSREREVRQVTISARRIIDC